MEPIAIRFSRDELDKKGASAERHANLAAAGLKIVKKHGWKRPAAACAEEIPATIFGERLELEVVDEPINEAVAQLNATDCDEALAEVDDDERIRFSFFATADTPFESVLHDADFVYPDTFCGLAWIRQEKKFVSQVLTAIFNIVSIRDNATSVLILNERSPSNQITRILPHCRSPEQHRKNV